MVFYTLLFAYLYLNTSAAVEFAIGRHIYTKVTRSLQDSQANQGINIPTYNDTIDLSNNHNTVVSTEQIQHGQYIESSTDKNPAYHTGSAYNQPVTLNTPAQSYQQLFSPIQIHNTNPQDDINNLIKNLQLQNPDAHIIVVGGDSAKLEDNIPGVTIVGNNVNASNVMDLGIQTQGTIESQIAHDDPDSITNFDDYELQHLKYSNLYQKDGPITFEDIDTVEEVVEIVNGAYEAYYALLPRNTPEKKSALDRAADVLELYAKVRSFVNMVRNDRQKIVSDIKFLDFKINNLTTSQEDMLKFYGLNMHFEKAKVTADTYRGKDAQIDELFTRIFNMTPKFESNIKKMVTSISSLLRLAEIFKTQVEQLGQESDGNQVLKLIAKLDSVILIIESLITMEKDVKAAIQALKTSFNELKSYRSDIKYCVDEVNKLADYHRLVSLSTKKDALVSSCFMVFLTFIVVF